jgi:hypothetical protein
VASVGALALSFYTVSARAQPVPNPPPAPPSPQPVAPPSLGETLTGMAKAEYEAGKILFADQDFKNAIVKFQHAHEVSNDPRLLWNIAVCQKNLRQYSKMLQSIRRYRREAEAVLTDDDKLQAQEIIKTVEGFISAFDLTVNESGADVFVDGEKVGTTPIVDPLTLDVGERAIVVKKTGFKDSTKSLTVPGGGQVNLRVALVKELHRGRVAIHAGDNDTISIDNKVVAVGTWEGSLPSGGHTLRVSSEGMLPFQQELVIQDDKERQVDVSLEAEPTDPVPTILWVVGGLALAGAATGTGVYLFRTIEPEPVQGSIAPGSVQLGYSYGVSW